MPRRTSIDLYAETLQVLRAKGGAERITKLSYGVGVPVDRLKTLLQRLAKAGLIRVEEKEEGTLYILTPRGVEFLKAYWRMKSFLSTLEEQ